MDLDTLALGLTELIAPFLPLLMGGGRGGDADTEDAPDSVTLVWSRLAPHIEKDGAAKAAVLEVASSPKDIDARAGLRMHLRKLLTDSPALVKAIRPLMDRSKGALRAPRAVPNWRDLLGRDDRLVERLEMISLLRAGEDPAEVAKAFGTDIGRLFRLNVAFSLAGAAGLLSEEGIGNWLDRLDTAQPILRRLDMIRLVRSGNPVDLVARQYDALPEYVERINRRFAKEGVLGIVTEDELDRFQSLHPPTIRVCSYNLHGTHDGAPHRLRRLAHGFAEIDVHAAAFQEVVKEGEANDSGVQTSQWASAMTGYHYQSHFTYCHQFMEKYPEGVAVSTRCPVKDERTIDLTLLREGLKPTMPRNALALETEIHGRKVVFASVHLDHNADPEVRLAQGEKLAAELRPCEEGAWASVLAGDFNDVESSPVMEYLKSMGYRDAYRARHRDSGNTFPAGDARSRIDYILVKGRVTIVSSGLLADDPSLSDHIGIFAEIR